MLNSMKPTLVQSQYGPPQPMPHESRKYPKPRIEDDFRASKFGQNSASQFSAFKFQSQSAKNFHKSNGFKKSESYFPQENKYSLHAKKNDKMCGPENAYNKSRILIEIPLIQGRICKPNPHFPNQPLTNRHRNHPTPPNP
jgi:hypothetical protein